MKRLFSPAVLLVSLAVVAQQQLYLPSGAGKPFDVTRHSVPVNEIVGGGPPKDGIPALPQWSAQNRPYVDVAKPAI
jgi:hypothetical protein